MDGACTSETVGSYEGTFHIPITDWRRLIGICSQHQLNSFFPAKDLSMKEYSRRKINIEMCFCSNSYLNSALIRQLHLVTNSLLAVERMAWHLFMPPLKAYTVFIIDYTFLSVESCPPLYFAEKVDLAHSAIEVE